MIEGLIMKVNNTLIHVTKRESADKGRLKREKNLHSTENVVITRKEVYIYVLSFGA